MSDNEKKIDAVESAEVEKKDKPAKAKSDKPSLFKRIGKFFKDYKSELKKIVWFSKEETIRSTVLVIIVLVICSAVISGLDFGFSHLVNWLASLV